MRSKDSCPVWGEGAGKVPNWQLADALLYRPYGSVRGARSDARPYRDHLPVAVQGADRQRRDQPGVDVAREL